jgi:hypothetical protein
MELRFHPTMMLNFIRKRYIEILKKYLHGPYKDPEILVAVVVGRAALLIPA